MKPSAGRIDCGSSFAYSAETCARVATRPSLPARAGTRTARTNASVNAERIRRIISNIVTETGLRRVPFFHYVLHIPLIHIIAVILCYLRYGHVYWMLQSPAITDYPFTAPPGWGIPLPGVNLVWGVVVLPLYPLSRWFAQLKQRRTESWLGYL